MLESPDAILLIAPSTRDRAPFPEPGAIYLSLSSGQVFPGDGAWRLRIGTCGGGLRCAATPPPRIERAIVEALGGRRGRLVRYVGAGTGTRLAGAVRLYEAMGYERIASRSRDLTLTTGGQEATDP